MIPGFDFTSVIAAFGYPSAPIKIRDVQGVYANGQWSFDWDNAKERVVFGIALMNQSPENQIEQQGFFDTGNANLIVLDNVPMYVPGMKQFEPEPSIDEITGEEIKRDLQSFFQYQDRWYRIMSYDFIWNNTNCRSYNGVLFSEFGVSYGLTYQH